MARYIINVIQEFHDGRIDEQNICVDAWSEEDAINQVRDNYSDILDIQVLLVEEF